MSIILALLAMSITQPRIRIVAIGDSTTAGTPAFKSPREAPPNGSGDQTSQYAYWLMKTHPGWDVINQGVNAQRSDVIAARFDEDVIAKKPAVVVIIAGVNDVYQGRPAQHVKDQLAAMYARARAAGIRVVAGTIIPYNTATPDQNARMHDVNDWIRAQARADPAVVYVDTRAAVAAAGDPDTLASSPDGLHPDAAGYRRMADAIAPAIERALARRGAHTADGWPSAPSLSARRKNVPSGSVGGRPGLMSLPAPSPALPALAGLPALRDVFRDFAARRAPKGCRRGPSVGLRVRRSRRRGKRTGALYATRAGREREDGRPDRADPTTAPAVRITCERRNTLGVEQAPAPTVDKSDNWR